MIRNQKYKFKNNIKLIYLTFVRCTCICKFEKHKQLILSENYEKPFPIKIIKNHVEVEGEESSFLLILGDCPVGGSSYQWRTERVLGCSNLPLPEIPKALQNHAKLNPIVKTVKNC